MKNILYLILGIHFSSTSIAETRLGGTACDKYEDCLKEFGNAWLLTQNVSDATRKVFYENWKVLLDNKNIIMDEKFRVLKKNCKLAKDLVSLPEESPLGKILREQIITLEKISELKRDQRFIFESDLQPLKDFAGNKPGYFIGMPGVQTSKDAQMLLKNQAEWEHSHKNEIELYKTKNKKEFKSSCLKDDVKKIETIRSKLLTEHRTLSALENRMEKIQEECEHIYKFGMKISSRYQNNSLSKSRFSRMKEVAIVLCSPVDSINNLLDKKNGCSNYVEDIYSIVSPECESRGENTAKGNLCNGLHRHLVKTFIENPKYDDYLRVFVSNMRNSLKKKDKKDLLEMALDATAGDRLAAVRLLALVGHDEINTSMISIREQLIADRQFIRLAKADDLYSTEVHVFASEDERFKGTEVVKGNMTLFKDLIRSGSPVGGKILTGRYYHFIAGTLLSCELKAKHYGTFKAQEAASLAGKIYESFDFKSHIKTGVSLSDAIDNFRRDTAKQSAGGDLGSSYCP